MTDPLYEEMLDGTFVPSNADLGNGYVNPGNVTLGLPKQSSLPITTRLQSADLVNSICVHELAEALAVVNGVDVLLKGVPEGYERIAQEALDYIAATPACTSKGAR